MSSIPERRELQFSTLDEVVAEAERLVNAEVRTTGNHKFANILEHLARTHDMATGKLPPPRLPFMMRIMMRMKKLAIIENLAPGFNLPPDAEKFFWPKQDFEVNAAFNHLKESVENYKANGPLKKHPLFGKLPPEKVTELNCKHGALHLSFVHPV